MPCTRCGCWMVWVEARASAHGPVNRWRCEPCGLSVFEMRKEVQVATEEAN